MLASTLLSLAGLVSLSTAGYVLEDDYEPSSFFSMFDFFTGADPTGGYVNYVDQSTAQAQGLINTNGPVYIGVDSTNVASGSGRSSVRITSQKSYNHGLIILDLAHMPGGVCGTWPAFWTVGPNWPNSGEIDIIEGVNSQGTNSMTLHTGSGCTISNNGEFTGSLTTSNCNVAAPGQATNAGCQIDTSNTASFGTGFNADSGGVYATEWTSSAISIWFFPRSAIPADVASGNPDPTSWGTATASFSGGCSIDSFFVNQQIVFDTTFCGDWAGNVWSTDSVCSPKAATCQDFVQNNPSAFVDAFWSINSLKVYQSNGSPASSSPAASNAPLSIPATVASSVPGVIPTSLPASIPTSFATVPVPAPISSSSQSAFGGGHRPQDGFSFTGNAAAAVVTTTPALAAIVAPTNTDAVAVVPTPSAPSAPIAAASSSTTGAAAAVAPIVSATPEFVQPTTSTTSATISVAPESTTQAAAAPAVTAPPSSPDEPFYSDHHHYITVSALQAYQFPSEGEPQTAGIKEKAKRDLHRHLARHKRHGGNF